MQEYNLEKDHASIKKQIKDWEMSIDEIATCLRDDDVEDHYDCLSDLEQISQEMMAINI